MCVCVCVCIYIYEGKKSQLKEITTERNDCYSVLNVYFVKWRLSMSNPIKLHVISPVFFYKCKNLPRPRAGADSAGTHALIESGNCCK
jgi:hypothetical protein